MKHKTGINYENIDFLTGLYNRKYFIDHISFLIKNNIKFSTFIIDLNRFKLINDVYGHDIGDIVLEEVGRRFKKLEKDNLLFARFGGDEFAAIYQSTDKDKINNLGKLINLCLAEHIVVSESEFTISASIGVSRCPDDSKELSDLLKLADMAMYQAKKLGVNNEYLISDDLNRKLSERKKIEALLRKMNVEKDLFLEFQPIFDVRSMELQGMEALVRWNHETEGTIYPLDFIKVAEKIDVVKDITRWVFINSLKQIREWNEKYNRNLKISLNVADSCIHNKVFFENLQFMLENFNVKPSWLAIELGEKSLLASPTYMKKLLNAINVLGIDTHIHNFGTSPFLISEIKSFKIKTIKIDKKYITNMDDLDTVNIVNAIILLAHGLGVNVSAEGVETQEQYEKLKHYNCRFFQGFFKEQPLSKLAFEEKYLKGSI